MLGKIKNTKVMQKFKNFDLKWYHAVIFWLPGGMYILTAVLSLQLYLNRKYKNVKGIN